MLKISKKVSWLSLSFLLYLSINPSKTLAHSSNIDYQATSALEITAKFDNGQPMSNAQVVIYAPNNLSQPWLQGITDKEGKFVFAPDYSITGNWDVKVRIAGHGGVINIPIQSIPNQQISSNSQSTAETIETQIQKTDINQTNNSLEKTNDNSTVIVSQSTANKNSQSTPTMMQKLVMAVTGVWGFVGTALFFSRHKN